MHCKGASHFQTGFPCTSKTFIVFLTYAGLDLGTKHAQQEGRLPSHSTVAAWLEPSHENDYFSFTNVKLTESSLLFFKDSVTSPSDHQPPAEILLNQHEAVVPMVVRQVKLGGHLLQCNPFEVEIKHEICFAC